MKHPRKRAVPKKKDSEIRVLVDTNFWFVLFCLDKPDGGGEKFLANSASAMRAYREFAAEDVKVVSCSFQREELLKVSGRLARMFEGKGF